MTTKEKIIKELQEEFSDLTKEEIEEMAEMELKSAEIERRESSSSKGKKKAPVRKPDKDKQEIIDILFQCINDFMDIEQEMFISPTIVNNERQIDFIYSGANYSVTLTKHRKEK